MTTQGELPNIVERLRRRPTVYYSHAEIINLMNEAADLIERLRATPPVSPLEREALGRRIYEAQRTRLHDQSSVTAQRPWRDEAIPNHFWESFCLDADVALTTSPSPTEREGE